MPSKKPRQVDVSITGAFGLYSIRPRSKKARTWCQNKLTGEQTRLAGAIVCEGGDRCRAIAAGMVYDGLHVEVNGVDMTGFRRT